MRAQQRAPRIVRRALDAAPRVAAEYAPLAGFVAVTAAAALLGTTFNPTPANPATKDWYDSRQKSPLNPPPAVFGPVWGTLYAMIAVAGWRVYRTPKSDARMRALAWWAGQMTLNAAWSPIFFGARQPGVALADIGAMGIAIGGFTITARKVDRTAAWMMAPYMGWVTFAAYLNAEIVRRNR